MSDESLGDIARVSSVGRRGLLVMLDGEELGAVPAGSLMKDQKPVTGDRVRCVEGDYGRLVVREILPRGRCLFRTVRGGARKIVAANVDRVLIMVSVADPPFVRGVIDRIAVSAEWQGLESCVVLNKVDLAGSEGLPEADLPDYERAGYPVFRTSCVTGEGLDLLANSIEGECVVIAGHSGVGKTSLVRRLAPGCDLRVADVGERSRRGRHTTVATRLVMLGGRTFLVDTPGFRVFSTSHVPREELQECFPEFLPFLGRCRFRGCMHVSEPDCAVKSAVEGGTIPQARYLAYLSLMMDNDDSERDRERG